MKITVLHNLCHKLYLSVAFGFLILLQPNILFAGNPENTVDSDSDSNMEEIERSLRAAFADPDFRREYGYIFLDPHELEFPEEIHSANERPIINQIQQSHTERVQALISEISHEQACALRNNTRVLQDATSRRLNALQYAINGRKFYQDSRHKALWGKTFYSKTLNKNLISHKDKFWGSIFGCDFISDNNETLGFLVGFTKTNINYNKQYKKNYNKQHSIYTGLYGAKKINNILFNGSSIIGYATFKERLMRSQKDTNIFFRYHGISYFNKLTVDYLFERNDAIFGPEVSILFDSIRQNSHGHRSIENQKYHYKKIKDFYISCETGFRYKLSPINTFHKICPNIFIGYEFNLKQNLNARHLNGQAIFPSLYRNKDCFVVNVQIDIYINDKVGTNIQYVGRYGKYIQQTGVILGIEYTF